MPDLDHHIRKHLANKRWQHEQGECAGIDCPWCEHERETGTGRYAPRAAINERKDGGP